MPAKTEFLAQPEGAARGFDRRRGAAAAGRVPFGVQGASKSGGLRSACENTNPNAGTGANGKRSPRLGANSVPGPIKIWPRARGKALGDITNITNGPPGLALKPESCQHYPAKNSFVTLGYTGALVTAVTAEAAPPATPVVEAVATELIDGADRQAALSEYVPDIHRQLFHCEMFSELCADYMDTQMDITPKMRTILIDWLVEVHMKYRMCRETLHLTANLIDRYLTKVSVTRKRLQLVGVSAMLIASKFEEICPPELHDFVFITDNAYTKEDILVMECKMLTTLSFQIVVPTAVHFFDMLETVNTCDDVHRDTARYLLDLSLLDVRMLQYTPSHVVAAALLLSNELFRRSPLWPAAMAGESHQTEESLRSCVMELRQLFEVDQAGAGGELRAVHNKWSAPERNNVAKMKF